VNTQSVDDINAAGLWKLNKYRCYSAQSEIE